MVGAGVVDVLGLALAAALTLTGPAVVTDGDTIKIQGQKVRLFGIDAPEAKQWCEDENRKAYACGIEAKAWLTWLLHNVEVTCKPEARKDRYGRVLAVCYTDGISINEWMVGRGQALAYIAYSRQYLAVQVDAEARGVGIWRGTFTAPWEWRAERRKAK